MHSDIGNIPAVILAGGLGTRLRSVINDLPKPMAPVNGRPFLHYLFQYLKREGIGQAILSVGYKAEAVKEFFGEEYLGISVSYSTEEEPLGTGGGILQAMQSVNECCFIINGDTFFDVSLQGLYEFHCAEKSDLTLALKAMHNFERYGRVECDATNRVIAFREKEFCAQGDINGGAYVLHKNFWQRLEQQEGRVLPQKFSFEKDVLEKHLNNLTFCGFRQDGYFIDIGIPEDYERAQRELTL